MPFAVGETVGPYNLVVQLGQGGMATVYKAYHPALDRYVAIKVLHIAFMDDTNFLARFQREALAVARLEDPNIVPVYDFSEFLILLFLCLVVGGQVLRNGAAARATRQAATQAVLQAASTGTAAPVLLMTPPTIAQSSTPDQIALKKAVTSWSNENMQD